MADVDSRLSRQKLMISRYARRANGWSLVWMKRCFHHSAFARILHNPAVPLQRLPWSENITPDFLIFAFLLYNGLCISIAADDLTPFTVLLLSPMIAALAMSSSSAPIAFKCAAPAVCTD
ncbi:hypothetical protein [Pseudomonas sp. OIL-1]|uniref:hypothetical protein n=1 Tax=Pseudomonas sp. OIL-1 TaxID=2706126 RepID=UPI0013A74385|nr:hypothetical protein [Pseudomonas sp. OIL-1]QIB50523.1 hypothetical protein G3M63_05200 [Pseudomonas sp. OIL-1]